MRVVVIDLEANGLLNTVTQLHCAVAMTLDGKEVWRFEPHQMKEFCSFLDTVDVWVGHNIIQYDIPAVKKVLGYEFKGKRVDTLLMSRLQNPHRTAPFHAKNKKEAMKVHGLYAWGVRVGIDKPEIEHWDEYNPEILHRCEEDVKINVAVYHELRKEAKGQNWRNAHLLTFKLWENLGKQEEAGWLIDQEYMKKSIRLLDHWVRKIDIAMDRFLPTVYEINETKKDGEYNYVRKPFMKSGKYSASVEKHYADCADTASIYSVVGPFSRITFRKVNLNSNDETKKFLLAEGWIPEVWNTDSEGRPTSPKMSKDEKFIGVNGKMGRLIVKRVQALHRRSQIEGWLRRVREDGRITARVSGIADTRRMKHADVVNVPNDNAFFGHQMRAGFVARPGWKLVGCDAASCQDRMLAARANNPEFTKMLLEGDKDAGTDGHSLARDAINEVLKRFNLKPISRGVAKNFNYGWKFGASDNKLGKMAGAGKEVGAEIRAALGKVFPAQQALIDKLTEEWRSHAKKRMNKWGKVEYYDGWITGLDGSPIFIAMEHTILVYTLQSDEAIFMAGAYNFLHARLARKFKYGVDYVVVGWIHDEYQIECREEIAHEVAKIAEDCIAASSKFYNLAVPQAGEADIGNNWSETH